MIRRLSNFSRGDLFPRISLSADTSNAAHGDSSLINYQPSTIRYEMDAREIVEENILCLMPFVPIMQHAEDRSTEGASPRQCQSCNAGRVQGAAQESQGLELSLLTLHLHLLRHSSLFFCFFHSSPFTLHSSPSSALSSNVCGSFFSVFTPISRMVSALLMRFPLPVANLFMAAS